MRTPEEARRRQTAAKVASLTLANAFIFQEQLAAADRRVRPLRQLLDARDFVGEVEQHWKYICDNINYVPIFKLARNILLDLPAGQDSSSAASRLARTALRISQNKAALRHDLMGRIYHWLLHDAKYLGTYYTSVAAATLLLRLTFSTEKWPSMSWSDFETLSKFRVADLACGTGTLLMATSHAISDNVIKTSVENGDVVDEKFLRGLHQTLIENILHGYDVIPSAVHLTAASLGLMAPEIAFRKMQLYSLPLGKMPKGEVYLGSIEYINKSNIATQLNFLGQPTTGGAAEAVTGSGGQRSTAPLPDLDLCVMNPPFVRSVGGNLLFGSLPSDRKEMQQKLRQYLKPKQGKEVYASSTAGLGAVFIATADRHIKDGGRLALVIPAAIATGVSWVHTRNLIDQYYLLENMVGSHDPQKWSFSENTDLSEVLVIAKKSRVKDSSKRVSFVNLWENPGTIAQALAVSDGIARAEVLEGERYDVAIDASSAVRIGGRKVGEIFSLPLDLVRYKPWLGCAFAQTYLNRALTLLAAGTLPQFGRGEANPLPMVELGSLGELGPDRRDIYDGFEVETHKTSYSAFWGHNANEVRRLKSAPNRWLSPLVAAKPGRPLRRASDLWKKSGAIQIAERMRLNTQSLVAVRLENPALSNVWWPFATEKMNAEQEKALCLWMNSTPGLLVFIGHRVPTEGPWVQFKKPNLKAVPVLDVRCLDDNQVHSMAEAFDTLCSEDLGALPHMSVDVVRAQIDEAVQRSLGLDDMSTMREALAIEPVVANRSLLPLEKSTVPGDGRDQLSFI